MNSTGIIIGLCSFFIIGVLHPVVIKVEYYYGKNVWPVFLLTGVLCIIWSLCEERTIFSAILAVLGFSLLWSIRELFEQEERVKRGWFPANPKKRNKPVR